MKSSTYKAVFATKYLDYVTAIQFSLNFSSECSIFVMENSLIFILGGSNSDNVHKGELHMEKPPTFNAVVKPSFL